MPRSPLPLAVVTVAAGGLLVAILVGTVVPFRAEERATYDRALIERDAAVLYPEALEQLAQSEAAAGGHAASVADLLAPVLRNANIESRGAPPAEGMLAAAVFDGEGKLVQFAPATLLLPELSPEMYPRLLGGEQISLYHPDFPLDQYFAGVAQPAGGAGLPVLEVLLPLPGRDAAGPVGFVQYFIDARRLAVELAAVDRRFNRETTATLAIGGALIALVLGAAYFGFRRAQGLIAERNERLVRANFELTLAAKASALGQITSHLIHGLQGSVAGLSAVVTERSHDSAGALEWRSAATYTARLQAMIQETVALLGDEGAQVSYVLTGRELADTIRRRNAQAAADKGVGLRVTGEFEATIDSHRGSLLCLIAANLVQNAIQATPAGGRVEVVLRDENEAITLAVTDDGPGIPPAIQAHLFVAGRSGRPGGTGLGLAISRLLARQIGANLGLEGTGAAGTTFQLTLPR